MDRILTKFLLLRQHLVIPQIGIFRVEQVPARFEEGSGRLLAPYPEIRFSAGDKAAAEKSFFAFLADESGMDELSAIKSFHSYCHDLHQQLSEKGSVVIEGTGTLQKTEEDNIIFQPAQDTGYLFPAVEVGAVTIDNDAPATDYWWFYAIILAILGLGALVYYFI